jgi:hypothetical protein
MFLDAMDLTDSGLLELRKRLEAYADARLTPSAAATIRMRTNVMNAAHRRAALIAADGTLDAVDATTAGLVADQARDATNAWRKPAAAILAGFLTLGVLIGTGFAAQPGGPLYAARIWTEMANLPAGVVARAEAEVGRLDARIQEAQQASTAGDGPAVEAALAAYSAIVVEAARDSGGDPTASAAIEFTVTRHVVVLTLMIDNVPPPARAAVEQALSTSAMVLEDLEGAGAQDGRDRPAGSNAWNVVVFERTKPAHPPREGEAPGAAAPGGEVVIRTDRRAKGDTDDKDVREPGLDPRRAGRGGSGGASHDAPVRPPPGNPTNPNSHDCHRAGPDEDGET